MIKTRKDLKDYIKMDLAPFSFKKNWKLKIWAFITKDINYYRIRYCVHLRKLEYAIIKKRPVSKWFHKLRKNKIGQKFGWEIPSFVCGPGLHLWHANVVINDDAKIGANALFHGNNCIGRKGEGEINNLSPEIGDNLNLGFGSVIIGPVKLKDNIIIGANTTVVKSFEESDLTIVGSPARIVKNEK